jgi:phospholipid/cholesterol/gamma-HCH transport system substrate-binding protein
VAAPGSYLPSREPFEISDMLEQMSTTIVKITATVDVLTAQVQHVLDTVVVTVDNANTVITAVSEDVTVIARSGARISDDLAEITAQVRDGRGTIPRLLNDEALYRRIAATVEHGAAIAADAQKVVADVRATVERLQTGDTGVSGLTSDLRQTLAEARSAMSGFADNMDALKRNFLFRGFFNRRGYFDLNTLSPEEYRQGALTDGGKRPAVRIWLTGDVLFAGSPDAAPVLTADGRGRLDGAVSTFLDRLPAGVLMVEGYSRQGTQEEQYRTARARAAVVRDYLIAHFGLDPERTGLMPLGDGAVEDAPIASWTGEGIAVAYYGAAVSR